MEWWGGGVKGWVVRGRGGGLARRGGWGLGGCVSGDIGVGVSVCVCEDFSIFMIMDRC